MLQRMLTSTCPSLGFLGCKWQWGQVTSPPRPVPAPVPSTLQVWGWALSFWGGWHGGLRAARPPTVTLGGSPADVHLSSAPRHLMRPEPAQHLGRAQSAHVLTAAGPFGLCEAVGEPGVGPMLCAGKSSYGEVGSPGTSEADRGGPSPEPSGLCGA